MTLRLLTLIVAFAFSVPAMAQGDDSAGGEATDDAGMTDAPLTDEGLVEADPPVVTSEEDETGRDKDPMAVDADAGVNPAAGNDPMVGGNRDSIIQGGGAVLPEGTNQAMPIGGTAAFADVAGFELTWSGFVQAEAAVSIFDNDEYEATFLPRELELDLEARHDNGALVRIDINLMTSPEAHSFTSYTDLDLYDALIEQAFVEWRGGQVTLRAGKMNAPFGIEPLDAHERIDLSRSTLSRLVTPDLLTGIYAGYGVVPSADVYLIAVNGWDLTLDSNRSKTLGGGVPHRFVPLEGGGYLYEGNLSVIAGAERVGVNDLRWLIDYSARIHLLPCLELLLELARGQEDGEGYNRRGMKDGIHAADWWGGMLTVDLDPAEVAPEWARPWAAAVRFEYIHDQDLMLHLPRHPNLPDLTTLLGTAVTLRYDLVAGVQAIAEYRVDFERGDVENVSVQRNVGNPLDWFVTQEITFGLLGYF